MELNFYSGVCIGVGCIIGQWLGRWTYRSVARLVNRPKTRTKKPTMKRITEVEEVPDKEYHRHNFELAMSKLAANEITTEEYEEQTGKLNAIAAAKSIPDMFKYAYYGDIDNMFTCDTTKDVRIETDDCV